MGTYFETLLHRKRGEYGPLWLFELDPETWAIVWEECLDDEDACRTILSEDPDWFNQEWGKDGRRPNPTYRTAHQALEEIIRLLGAMKEMVQEGDVKRNHYSAYAGLAQHHLHTLTVEVHSSWTHADELPSSEEQASRLSSLYSQPVRAGEEVQPLTELKETPSALATQAAEPTKPWEVVDSEPTGSNFRPDLPLHGKMEWVCNNVPKMSRLRILREGAELLCDQLIAKYYKG